MTQLYYCVALSSRRGVSTAVYSPWGGNLNNTGFDPTFSAFRAFAFFGPKCVSLFQRYVRSYPGVSSILSYTGVRLVRRYCCCKNFDTTFYPVPTAHRCCCCCCTAVSEGLRMSSTTDCCSMDVWIFSTYVCTTAVVVLVISWYVFYVTSCLFFCLHFSVNNGWKRYVDVVTPTIDYCFSNMYVRTWRTSIGYPKQWPWCLFFFS